MFEVLPTKPNKIIKMVGINDMFLFLNTLKNAINNNLNYICSETLADEIHVTAYNSLEKVEKIELTEGVFTRIELLKR